jgi:hypothetical protein
MMRQGLTLLEVIIAISLSALMLTALIGVLTSLYRQRKQATISHYREWAYELDRVFWNDLAQARGVALSGGSLTMVAPSSRNWSASQSSSSIGGQLIVYRLESTGKNRSKLTRSIYRGNSIGGNLLIFQTLLWDVRLAKFERVDDQGNSQPLPAEIGPTPRAFRYQLWINDEEVPHSNQILVR